MKKRDREEEEEEEELIRRAVKEAIKKAREEKGEKIATPVQNLIQHFNTILKEIISEKGVECKTVEEDLLQFSCLIRYPNEIDVTDIQTKIFNVDAGVGWINYELTKPREMKMVISYTTNKALKIKYLSIHQREAQLQKTKVTAEQESPPSDASMVLYTLRSNLSLNHNIKPIVKARPPVEGLQIVSVIVGVHSPLKNHQIERIFAEQHGKIKGIRIDPHPDQPTIRMTVEILCEVEPSVTL